MGNSISRAPVPPGHSLSSAGLRPMECLRLRVKDIDFGANQITIREGKGDKDRITMLPEIVRKPLKDHLERVKKIHDLSARGRLRHSDYSRVTRAQGCQDDDDLHACIESRRQGCQKPSRCALILLGVGMLCRSSITFPNTLAVAS